MAEAAEKTNQVIHYTQVETYIKKLEKDMEELDDNEKALIISFLSERIQRRKQKQMTADVMGNMQINGMVKQIKKTIFGG